ncbi:MAG: hypothetical protein KAZ95_02905 [Rhodoluna sp.]|nr:hypothetical protein [Rhodoluna sp.]
MLRKLNKARIWGRLFRGFTNMNELPLPVLIGTSMILVGIVLGIYVAVKAISRNRRGNDLLD